MKRQRGRGRKPGGNQQNRSFESNGPDVKIRGNASTIYEKYLQIARDASSSGDRVMAENYYQHAEHYFRIVQANQPKRDDNRQDGGQQNDQNQGAQNQGGQSQGGQNQGSDNQADAQEDRNDRSRGRGRGRRDDGNRRGEGRAEPASEKSGGEPASKDASAETAEKRPRRERRKKDETSADASDPLAVVDPEGESEQSGGSELTADDAPKRKPRAPRKPRGDKAAQDALDKVCDGKSGSGGDKDSEAA